METRAHYVLIGAFVLASMAIMAIVILWLGQNRVGYDEYDIVFTERVSGLTKGAPVRFNGVQKGEVLELNISADNPSVVIARVRVENDTPVKTDTNAELELVGFTGLAVIQLVGGTKEAELLKEAVRGVPSINADSSGLAAFLEGSGEIITAANRLLSEENTEAFTRIIASIDVVTQAIADNEDEIRATFRNAATSTAELADTLAKLDSAAESLDTLLEKDAAGVLRETEGAAVEAQLLMAELRGVVAENREALSLFAEQGLPQVGPAFAEARRAFRTLDDVLREIDRDPRGYLLGESIPQHEGDE